jgi:WD40 repeat protein
MDAAKWRGYQSRYASEFAGVAVMRLVLAVCLVGFLRAHATCNAADLRVELRNESQEKGMALVSASDRDVVLIPFDASEKRLEAPYRPTIAAFGKGGQVVLWWFKKTFLDLHGECVIDSTSGHELATSTPPVAGFHPLTLSEVSRRVAFFSNPGNSLGWASFDFSARGDVDTGALYPDWSPDGSQLAYERSGEIRVFDVSKSSSRRIASGHAPTWSPDGMSIAATSTDGYASLLTTDGSPLKWHLQTHRPLGPIRWSQDGRYVSFAERIIGSPPLGPQYRLVVSRVSDGETITVKEFGGGAVGYATFEWIVNYREFCPKCTPIESPGDR